MSSVHFGQLALILSPQDAPYGAFSLVHQDISHRIKMMRKQGWCIDQPGLFPNLFDAADYLEKTYAHGMQMQIWRGYGSSKTFCFSSMTEGKISSSIKGKEKEAVERICRLIKEGGVLFTESSSNGAGKKSIAKFLASLCNPRVCVISSQKDAFAIDLLPDLPQYQRCIAEGKDVTRIYYKTASGKVQNIPVGALNLLWGFLGRKKETFSLCLDLLGCKKDPEAFKQVLEQNQEILSSYLADRNKVAEDLKKTRITTDDLSPFWQEALSEMRSTLQLDPSIESCTQDLLLGQPGHIDERMSAYLFLFGIAILDHTRVLLSLLDDGNADPNGPLSQCIHAVSGLKIPAEFSNLLSAAASEAVAMVKQSYLQAKAKGGMDVWFHALASQQASCANDRLNAFQELHEKILMAHSNRNQAEASQAPDFRSLWRASEALHLFQGKERFELFKHILRKEVDRLVSKGNLDALSAVRILAKIDQEDLKTVEDQVGCVRSLISDELQSFWPMVLDCLISADFFEALALLHPLIEAGIKDGQEILCLHNAVKHGNLGALWMLLELNADPDGTDVLGNTALHLATSSGWINGIRALRKGGADCSIKNYAGWTPYDIAQFYDNWEAGQAFLHEEEDEPIEFHGQPLFLKTASPRDDFFFLPKASILEKHERDGNQRFGIFQQSIVGRFREQRIDLPVFCESVPNTMEQKAFWIKKLNRFLQNTNLHQYVFSVLNTMIDLNYFEGIACFSTDFLQMPDAMGKTPLHLAAAARQSESLRVLLDMHLSLIKTDPTNLSLNAVDNQGNTALHIAVAKRWVDGAKLLCIAGIDREIRNLSGKTALDLARESQSEEMLSALNLEASLL